MGGKGTRLGTLTPKPLMPIITDDGLVGLWEHADRRLRAVTHEVYALVHTDSCSCVRRVPLPQIVTSEDDLSAALAEAAAWIIALHGEDAFVALAFPDSLWQTEVGLAPLVEAMRSDGAVALFDAPADQLDWVDCEGSRVRGIVTKRPGASGIVRGWGAFIVRADRLQTFTAAEKDGPQLGRLDLGWAYIGAYADLGTPERYIANHDQRGRDGGLQPPRAGLA